MALVQSLNDVRARILSFSSLSLIAIKWLLLLQPSYLHSWKDEGEKDEVNCVRLFL